jgi:2,3-diketo-5-methylthio-1-phosphopentane phosphatase
MTTTGANSASGKLSPAILTDFDDTAAAQNVAELLLNRFGDPTWTQVRQQFRDGQLNLKEYQEITFRNIQADRSAMQYHVHEHATLRPYFAELYAFCRNSGIPLAVVSQGLDFYISALLERDGFGDVPIYAVNTTFDQGEISYHYNHIRPGNERQGNSKALIVEQFQKQGYYVLFAGDGASDQEASVQADMVFAHRTLARFCDEQGIEYKPFSDFQSMLLNVRELHLNGSAPR